MAKKIVAGGQAVIEGILMRSPNFYSIAVRKPDKSISVKTEKHISYTKRNKFWGLPILRGMAVLGETLVLGTKSLFHSANESGESDEQLTTRELALTLGISIVVALLVFKFLPLLLANFLTNTVGLNNFWFNLADGLIKILILLGYLWALSFMKDIQRMFEYHGAEHMSVHCYEHNKPLTVPNVRKFGTAHPRCGTEFLLLVFIISIAVYMFIPFDFALGWKYLLRVLLLPLVAGLSYELLKAAGKYYSHWFFRAISYPGMMLQKITTNKPADDQIEVAIASLKAVLSAEKRFLARKKKQSGAGKNLKKKVGSLT